MGGSDIDVSIVTSGHDVADARLHREVAALLERGLSVEVLGLGDSGAGPAGAEVRTWPRRTQLGRPLLALRMVALARGSVLLTLDPDAAIAGAVATRLRHKVHVVDSHEDFGALLKDRPWARRNGGLNHLAATAVVRAYLLVAGRAALTVVADDQVPPVLAGRRVVLHNLPYPGMLPALAPPDPAPRALYVGDVRASRGVFAMVEALRAAPQWSLDIVGPVALADLPTLRRLLEEDPELGARVHVHGRRPPRRAWADAAGAWCGLALLADTPAFRDAMPSKVYEYLGCGLPVITTDLPRPAELVRSTGAGVVVPVGDRHEVARAVAEVLNTWAAAPGQLADLRARAAVLRPSEEVYRQEYSGFADAVAALLPGTARRVDSRP